MVARSFGRGVGSAIAKFAVSGAVALALVGLLAALTLRRQGTEESIRDAKIRTRTLAHAVVQPALTPGLLGGDPQARARFDRLVRDSVLGDGVVRVKLWTRDGRVVYADDARLIGGRYTLGSNELAAFDRDQTEAGISELARSENRFERGYGRLLEVYLPLRTQDGTPVLFETYQLFSAISSESRRLWILFAPAVMGGLLLLWLVQVPLAASLARRVRRANVEREAALCEAVAASERERFVIAGDLHDGVVQDLAGVSMTLAAAVERLTGGPDIELRDDLEEATATTRTAMRRLRSLIVEIYPSNLERVGLRPALADLAAPLAGKAMSVSVDVVDTRYPSSVEAIVYRAAQEALRNVAAHARAAIVGVRVCDDGHHVHLVVDDDGIGISEAELATRRQNGHLGFRLLADLARNAGGTLTVGPGDRGGTRVELVVPLR